MQTEQSLLADLGELYAHGRQYLDDHIEYTKLSSSKKIAITLSALITLAIFWILGLVALLFFFVSLGFFIAPLVGGYGWAFAIVTMFLVGLIIITYIFKNKWITNPILQKTLEKLLEE